ncbi:hypothetical protein C1646_758681 [Rhizophagus diaphanus]|nr:hypothetical protein C1646_758681 [Rhizophagus diaphanus] [Rhizophagus sp. MUCL 43196]
MLPGLLIHEKDKIIKYERMVNNKKLTDIDDNNLKEKNKGLDDNNNKELRPDSMKLDDDKEISVNNTNNGSINEKSFAKDWCKPCQTDIFKQNLRLDECQLEATDSLKLEWIDHKEIVNIEYIAKGGFERIWKNIPNTTIALKELYKQEDLNQFLEREPRKASDIYSFGIIMWIIGCCKLPYEEFKNDQLGPQFNMAIKGLPNQLNDEVEVLSDKENEGDEEYGNEKENVEEAEYEEEEEYEEEDEEEDKCDEEDEENECEEGRMKIILVITNKNKLR